MTQLLQTKLKLITQSGTGKPISVQSNFCDSDSQFVSCDVQTACFYVSYLLLTCVKVVFDSEAIPQGHTSTPWSVDPVQVTYSWPVYKS